MFWEKFVQLCNSVNKSPNRVAEELNYSSGSVTAWKKGRVPKWVTLTKIAEYFGVSVNYLLGQETNEEQAEKDLMNKIGAIPISRDTYTVPVVGKVAAGVPIEAIENIIGYIELDPKEFSRYNEYFGLQIKGDSMEPRIWDGDIVVVQKQPDVESGQIAVVMVGDNEATCKKVLKHVNGISLIPFNPKYDDRFFSIEEVNNIPISIIGKVVQLRSNF